MAKIFVIVFGFILLSSSIDATLKSAETKESSQSSHNCPICEPGWGLTAACDSYSSIDDITCVPCEPGTWTPNELHSKKCRPCSQCGPGLYASGACTVVKDTGCSSCTVGRPINADFLEKCFRSHRRSKLLRIKEVARNKDMVAHMSIRDGEQHLYWKIPSKKREDKKSLNPEPEFSWTSELGNTYRQRRTVVLSVILLTAVFCLLFSYCVCVKDWKRQHRRNIILEPPLGHRVYVHLTNEDNKMIDECVNRLRQSGRLKGAEDDDEDDGNDDGQQEWWEDNVHLTTNPMWEYNRRGHKHSDDKQRLII